jgi:hypothetical protein
MRQEFIACKTEKERDSKAPWSKKNVEVCGGYYCFESESDYDHFIITQDNKNK